VLATAKLNQAERFGVGLGETDGHNSGDDVPPERVYMELEEHYHTRLLAYVLDIFGLPFQVVAPPFVMRQFVKTAVFLPERVSFMFVGAAEMAGCIMFHELRRIGIELFADEPDVAARIERLYSEILTDEVGHDSSPPTRNPFRSPTTQDRQTGHGFPSDDRVNRSAFHQSYRQQPSTVRTVDNQRQQTCEPDDADSDAHDAINPWCAESTTAESGDDRRHVPADDRHCGADDVPMTGVAHLGSPTPEGADQHIADRVHSGRKHETPTGPTRRRASAHKDDRAQQKQRAVHHERPDVHDGGDSEIADVISDIAVAGDARRSDRLAHQIDRCADQPNPRGHANPARQSTLSVVKRAESANG
jgi:hypothetical protein